MKNFSSKLAFVIAIFIGGLSHPQAAAAADYLISLGNSSGEAERLTVLSGDRFLVDFAANRSYTCEGIPIDPLTDFDFSTNVERLDGNGAVVETLVAKAIGGAAPAITGDSGDSDNNRLTLTPTTKARYRFSVANAKSAGEIVKIRCFATTIFGPFNTTVNNFNFLELTNRGASACNAVISAVDQNGASAISNLPVIVQGQRRTDVDLHTASGPGKFGFVRVTHDCPIGSLDGYVSQYRGTISDFQLSVSLPLTTVDQRP